MIGGVIMSWVVVIVCVNGVCAAFIASTVRAKLSVRFWMRYGMAWPAPMPLLGSRPMKSAAVICVCWKACWKKTFIFSPYCGSCCHPWISALSCVGSAVTCCTSMSVGGRPTRRFLTFAT